LFGFFTTSLCAQKELKLDSLLKEYSKQPNDTLKYRTLILLFNAYLYNQPDKARDYALENLALSKQLNFKKGIAKSYFLLGAWYYNANQLDTAKIYYEKALGVFSKLNLPHEVNAVHHELAAVDYAFGNYDAALERADKNLIRLKEQLRDSMDLVLAYHLKGTVYNQMGHYDLALPELVKALEILQTLNEPLRLADALNLMGAVEFNLENFKTSIAYNEEALKVYRDQNDRYFEAQALNDIGNAYFYLKDFDLALSYLQQSEMISNELNSIALQATALNNMGKTYAALKSPNLALINFEKGLQLAEKSKEKNKITESLNDYSSALLSVNPQKAIGFLNRAIRLADSTNSISNKSIAYKLRSEAYALLNKSGQALHDYKQYSALRDSAFTIAKSQQIEQLRTMYDTAKKEQQIAHQENEINLLEEKEKNSTLQKWLLGCGLGLTLLLFGAGFYGIRQKIKLSKLEREALYAELNFKKKELTSHALQLAKKNEMLEGLKQKAMALKKNSSEKKNVQQLINTINFDLKHDHGWEHFYSYFEEVHTDFNKNILLQYPNITSNELRLMVLLKMNLNSKEIADILNISAEGVKKARQRLRKKMNLSADESLEALILSL
jgi:tetratricopeptide (TPR) repeat protein/DNA-binding CsgD family transcriptional regulator